MKLGDVAEMSPNHSGWTVRSARSRRRGGQALTVASLTSKPPKCVVDVVSTRLHLNHLNLRSVAMPSPTTLLGPNPARGSAPFPALSHIDLLPFSINHEGPALIESYFHPTPVASTAASTVPAPSAPGAEPHEAAFRGRLLVSSHLPLPAGYTGLVFSTSQPLPPAPVEVKTVKRARATTPEAGTTRASKRLSLGGGVSLGMGRRRSPRKAVRKAYALSSEDEEEVKEEDAAVEATEITIEETVATTTVKTEEVASEVKNEIPETEADTALLDNDVKYLQPVATFASIRMWNADHGLATLEDDLFSRGIHEFTKFAAMVSPVSDCYFDNRDLSGFRLSLSACPMRPCADPCDAVSQVHSY